VTLVVVREMTCSPCSRLHQLCLQVSGGYYLYTVLKSISAAVGKVVEAVSVMHETISRGLGDATKRVQDLSTAVQERVKPSLDKTLEELPGTIQTIHGKIEAAAGDAKNTIASYWEWVGRGAGGRK
jgi:uncharacterized phage infection (PIP) family protein YhgE